MRHLVYILTGLLMLASRLGFAMGAKSSPEFPVFSNYVKSCETDSGDGCFWYAVHKSSQCQPSKPCSKLVIFFPDQGQSCLSAHRLFFEGGESQRLNDLMLEYASDGYVAACASLYESPESYVRQSHSSEAHRFDKTIESITGSPKVTELWNGDHLLYAGMGSGASSTVIVMANSDYDRKRSWRGKKTTAGCLHDGSYDVVALESFLHKNNGSNGGACQVYRERNICRRYYSQETCNHPLPYNGEIMADTLLDTVQGTLNFRLGGLGILHWKLIECGSALGDTPCGHYLEGDVNPKEPIAKLCEGIDKGSQHHCQWAELPKLAITIVLSPPAGYDACNQWFKSLSSLVI